MPDTQHTNEAPPLSSLKVALYVTCLADLMRPSVAQASLDLLKNAGCTVSVPPQQTCCGQPAYNNGDYAGARRIAQQTIERFEPYDYVVMPSGSCAGMIIKHYPTLLDGEWQTRAAKLADRVFELTTFLLEICNYHPKRQKTPKPITYHDSCAGLRELQIRTQPRTLLDRAGVSVGELAQPDVCCGFGGTFCAKMPHISGDMADRKIEDLELSGTSTLVAGDLGCLLAMEGRASRTGKDLAFRHIAEVLIDSLDELPATKSSDH